MWIKIKFDKKEELKEEITLKPKYELFRSLYYVILKQGPREHFPFGFHILVEATIIGMEYNSNTKEFIYEIGWQELGVQHIRHVSEQQICSYIGKTREETKEEFKKMIKKEYHSSECIDGFTVIYPYR